MLRFACLVAFLLASCAASPPRITVQAPVTRDAQQLRFTRVDIDQMPMLAAVEALSTAAGKAHGEQFAFTSGYTAGAFPATPEGRVTFHGTDVSLTEILDDFCRQTHWTYRWVNIGYVSFQTGPGPAGYKPETRRPKT